MKKLFLTFLLIGAFLTSFAGRSLRATYTFKNVDENAGLNVTDITSPDTYGETFFINAVAFNDGVVFNLALSEDRNVPEKFVTKKLTVRLDKGGNGVFSKALKVNLSAVDQTQGLSVDVSTSGSIGLTWNPDVKTGIDGSYTLTVERDGEAAVVFPFMLDTAAPSVTNISFASGSAKGAINKPFQEGSEVADRYVKITITYNENVTDNLYGTHWIVTKGGDDIEVGDDDEPTVAPNGGNGTTITIDNGENYTDANGVRYQILSEDSKIIDRAGNPLTPAGGS